MVRPAQTLIVIAPQKDTLEVKVMTDNKNIGCIQIGQPQLKIENLLYTKYGTI